MRSANMRQRAHIPRNSGQSLVELLVAIGVVAVIAASVAAAIVLTLRVNEQSEKARVGSALAQEMLDKVRAVAEGSWQDVYGLPTKASTSTYFTIASGTALAVIEGKEGVPDNDIRAGLVAHWKFDEATGTTAYDASGDGNNGVLTNGPARQSGSNCKVGACLSFDGVDDWINLSSSSQVDLGISDFTITGWIKSSFFMAKSTNWPNTTSANGWTLYTRTTNPYIVLNWGDAANNDQYFGFSSTSLSDGLWHHFAVSVVRNGPTTGFIDGVQTVSANNTVTGTLTNSAVLRIFRSIDGSYVGPGSIDDVRIYNRALSASEIRQLYTSSVYTRWFSVENVSRDANGDVVASGGTEDPSTQKITAWVQWDFRGDTAETTVVEYLTRWPRDRVTAFTDWSGSSGVEGPVTKPDANYSTSTNLSTSTPGQLTL